MLALLWRLRPQPQKQSPVSGNEIIASDRSCGKYYSRYTSFYLEPRNPYTKWGITLDTQEQDEEGIANPTVSRSNKALMGLMPLLYQPGGPGAGSWPESRACRITLPARLQEVSPPSHFSQLGCWAPVLQGESRPPLTGLRSSVSRGNQALKDPTWGPPPGVGVGGVS